MNCPLRTKRQEVGLTQRQMADAIGIGLCSYNKKELGRTRFTLEEGMKIARVLNAGISGLFLADQGWRRGHGSKMQRMGCKYEMQA